MKHGADPLVQDLEGTVRAFQFLVMYLNVLIKLGHDKNIFRRNMQVFSALLSGFYSLCHIFYISTMLCFFSTQVSHPICSFHRWSSLSLPWVPEVFSLSEAPKVWMGGEMKLNARESLATCIVNLTSIVTLIDSYFYWIIGSLVSAREFETCQIWVFTHSGFPQICVYVIFCLGKILIKKHQQVSLISVECADAVQLYSAEGNVTYSVVKNPLHLLINKLRIFHVTPELLHMWTNKRYQRQITSNVGFAGYLNSGVDKRTQTSGIPWKMRDFPKPVGSTANTSFPRMHCRIAFRCCGLRLLIAGNFEQLISAIT